MQIPSTIDMTQNSEKLTTPEIRVWCHPHFIGKEGEDYYKVFFSFARAENFIKKHKEAERIPLVAFRGYEVNLYQIETSVAE